MSIRLLLRPEKVTHLPGKRLPKRVQRSVHHIVWDSNKDVHLQEGVIAAKDFKKADGSIVTSSKGHEFLLLTPSFSELFTAMEKKPQTIPLKDLGWIAATTGVNATTHVIDIGGGSGGSACFWGRLCKHVDVLEIRDDHAEVIGRNVKRFGLKNVNIHICDATSSLPNLSPADLVMIDLPNPWEMIPHLESLVTLGGFVVNYSPPVPSMQKFVDALSSLQGFSLVGSYEIIERPWKVVGEAVRPKAPVIEHSGFLTVVRRIQ